MRKREWNAIQRYLILPMQNGVDGTQIRLYVDGQMMASRLILLAETRIDHWICVDLLSMGAKTSYALEMDREDMWTEAVQMTSSPWGYGHNAKKPLLHYASDFGTISEIISLKYDGSLWRMEYCCDVLGIGEGVTDIVTLVSLDLLHWEVKAIRYNCPRSAAALPEAKAAIWTGDISSIYTVNLRDQTLIMAIGNMPHYATSDSVMSIPMFISNGIPSPPESIQRLRVWQRSWKDIQGVKAFEQKLAFRIAPGNWPNINILPPENREDDITAEAFEISIDFFVPEDETVTLDLCGNVLRVDTYKLVYGEYDIELDSADGWVSLTAFIDRYCAEILCGGHILFAMKQDDGMNVENVDNRVSGNLEKCVIEHESAGRIRIGAASNRLVIRDLTVYGLRSSRYGEEAQSLIKGHEKESRLFYKGDSYCVYNNRVSDVNYGYPDAWVPNDHTVVSPVRVMEEFEWRDTPWGDMVRAIDRKEIWHPHYDINRYPAFTSGVASLDAAYNIALDTFCRCTSREFALPGQEGMWAAGLLQGPGQGFGVWMRDSAHIALRCGNLLDPATARRTLLYTSSKGFDNGTDGPAMAIVGLWDYYLATGDNSVLYEAWPHLLSNIDQAEERFLLEYGLVRAGQSTSNDAFDEPESDGFCLSTEIYFMKAYESMAEMGELICYNAEAVSHWRSRSKSLRKTINQLYWNDSLGYYTAGPKGSESYKKGYWETSGAEGAVWSKFGIADVDRRRSVLKRMKSVAMTDYGIKLFPYKDKQNHFCGSIWTVWEAGIAAAASGEGDCDLVHQLISQQVRSCIMNKTFYEVIDADTGISWRWPGQLWHAAGFVSLLFYGLFGISYDEEGMHFSPAVSRELANSRLSNLHYGRAILDIEVYGHGTCCQTVLDGNPCEKIPPNIEGKHIINLQMQSQK